MLDYEITWKIIVTNEQQTIARYTLLCNNTDTPIDAINALGAKHKTCKVEAHNATFGYYVEKDFA